jgi:hypothetical protein
MNAPLRNTAIQAEEISPPPIKIFIACAEKYALSCAFGEMDAQTAVDCLQSYAECAGLSAELGQDRIQDIMAAAFIWAGEVDDTVSSDYAGQIVRRWELADPRDRWQHTGEAPPSAPSAESLAVRPYRTPQSTIDAFWCAASAGDAQPAPAMPIIWPLGLRNIPWTRLI